MLTLRNIRSRVRTRFEASSSTRWSDADINESINDGLEELSEATGYFERWASLKLKQDRNYYDLRGLSPDTILSVSSIWHESGNRWLTQGSFKDIGYEEWEKTNGDPILWFTRGQWWLGLWPHPSSDVDEFVRVYFQGVAPRMTEDGEEPRQLPDEFVPALEEYALYELTQREGETQKALMWWDKYKAREKALNEHLRHRVSTARTGRVGR